MSQKHDKRRKRKWPSTRAVRQVIRHLEEDLGLSIYGPVYFPESHEVGPPCSDFDADRVIAYRTDMRLGRLEEVEHF